MKWVNECTAMTEKVNKNGSRIQAALKKKPHFYIKTNRSRGFYSRKYGGTFFAGKGITCSNSN